MLSFPPKAFILKIFTSLDLSDFIDDCITRGYIFNMYRGGCGHDNVSNKNNSYDTYEK